MKYFVNFPYSAESLKNEYRELCKKLHPDTGGDAEEFKAMQNEYAQVLKTVNGGSTSRAAHDDSDAAQDFADMMGAPLNGTKGKTFADLVAELAAVMADDARRAAYLSDAETWICYGWDGCSMTPESRPAYLKKFGRVVVEMAELCATMKAAAEKKADEATQYAAHVREARKNQSEGNKAPKAGAFVFGVGCNWKSDGGRGVFVNFEAFAADPDEYGKNYDDEERRHVCKVVEVFEVSAEDFARPGLADELVQRATAEGREFAGGFATDDPEPADDPRDPYKKYKYYYTECAAVVCRESGRWFLIDAEGYSYARYCYMPTSWRTMYADEISEAQRKQAEREEQERQEEERKAAERLAEYRAKCAKYEAAGLEDLTEYREAANAARHEECEAGRAHGYRSPEYKAAQKKAQAANAAQMAAEKRNIKAMAAAIYPGIKCKVTKADSWRSAGYKLTYEDGPTLDEFTNNTDFDLFAAYWEEYRMDDCTELHRHDLTEFADKYGDGRGVEVVREMSKSERERMTAAIIAAVPAAAGICWENRHDWTQDEIKAAAAAVGVDGWELWKVYDHKHTYFNYVTAESLAEWAHELTAYDIKGKKTRTTSTQSESRPQESTTAAEPTNTKQENREAVTANESNAQGLTMEKYSEKATVIRGYNADQLAELLAMGGKEWHRLKGGKGVIFSTRRHADELAAWMEQQQGEGTTAPAADQPADIAPATTLQEAGEISDTTNKPAAESAPDFAAQLKNAKGCAVTFRIGARVIVCVKNGRFWNMSNGDGTGTQYDLTTDEAADVLAEFYKDAQREAVTLETINRDRYGIDRTADGLEFRAVVVGCEDGEIIDGFLTLEDAHAAGWYGRQLEADPAEWCKGSEGFRGARLLVECCREEDAGTLRISYGTTYEQAAANYRAGRFGLSEVMSTATAAA